MIERDAAEDYCKWCYLCLRFKQEGRLKPQKSTGIKTSSWILLWNKRLSDSEQNTLWILLKITFWQGILQNSLNMKKKQTKHIFLSDITLITDCCIILIQGRWCDIQSRKWQLLPDNTALINNGSMVEFLKKKTHLAIHVTVKWINYD